MQIDHSAPVKGDAETQIAAPPELVWDVLAALGEWPTWNPDVESVTVEGPVEPGTEFHWQSGRTKLTSTLEQVDPPKVIAWTGRTSGIRAVHIWRLDPSAGGTRVRTEEAFVGFLARLLKGRLQKTLDDALANGLAHLKAESERRAASHQG